MGRWAVIFSVGSKSRPCSDKWLCLSIIFVCRIKIYRVKKLMKIAAKLMILSVVQNFRFLIKGVVAYLRIVTYN